MGHYSERESRALSFRQINQEVNSTANSNDSIIQATANHVEIVMKNNIKKYSNRLSSLSELSASNSALNQACDSNSFFSTSSENITKQTIDNQSTINKHSNNLILRKSLTADKLKKIHKIVNRSHSIDNTLLLKNTINNIYVKNVDDNAIKKTVNNKKNSIDLMKLSSNITNSNASNKYNVTTNSTQQSKPSFSKSAKLIKLTSLLTDKTKTSSFILSKKQSTLANKQSSQKKMPQNLKNVNINQIDNNNLLPPIYSNQRSKSLNVVKDLSKKSYSPSSLKTNYDKKNFNKINKDQAINILPQLINKSQKNKSVSSGQSGQSFKTSNLQTKNILKSLNLNKNKKNIQSVLHNSKKTTQNVSNLKINKIGSLESELNILSKLPVTLPYPSKEIEPFFVKTKNQTTTKNCSIKSNSNKSNNSFDSQPDFIAADVDLDLPGPYMLPAKEDDLKHNKYLIQKHNKKKEIKNNNFTNAAVKSINTNSMDNNAYKLNTKKFQNNQQNKENFNENKYNNNEYTVKDRLKTPQQILEKRMHEKCLINRPDWNSSPIRNGEIDQIPLNWNTATSSNSLSQYGSFMSYNSLIALNNQRLSKSSNDLHTILVQSNNALNYKTNATNKNKTQRKQVVTFDEKSIELAERSRSMLDIRKEPWRSRLKMPKISTIGASPLRNTNVENIEQRQEWVNRLKELINSRTWLDFN